MRRLIALSRGLGACKHQSAVPFRGDARPPRRTMACSRVSTSGTIVWGSSQRAASISDLQVAARIERTAVDEPRYSRRRFPVAVARASASPVNPVARWYVRRGRSGRSASRNSWRRARGTDEAHKAFGQIARRTVVRVVDDSRSRWRLAPTGSMPDVRSPPPSPTRTDPARRAPLREPHRRPAPAALPRTATVTAGRPGVSSTCVRCHASGTD